MPPVYEGLANVQLLVHGLRLARYCSCKPMAGQESAHARLWLAQREPAPAAGGSRGRVRNIDVMLQNLKKCAPACLWCWLAARAAVKEGMLVRATRTFPANLL